MKNLQNTSYKKRFLIIFLVYATELDLLHCTKNHNKEEYMNPSLKLFNYLMSHLNTQVIKIAVEEGIPDLLFKEAKTIDEIASCIKVEKNKLERVMRMLCHLDIFTIDNNGKYHLTPVSELLLKDSSGYRATALITGKEYYEWTGNLSSVMKGEDDSDFFDYLNINSARELLYNQSMSEFSRSADSVLLDQYDFSMVDSILDINGGKGDTLSQIVKKYPHVRAILFEKKSVIQEIRKKSNNDLSISLETGNLLLNIPTNIDLYILKYILHCYDDEKALQILRNCARSMKENSKLLIVEHTILPENNPYFVLYIDMIMMTLLNGKERSIEEIEYLLDTAGLKVNSIINSEIFMKIIEVEKK